VTIDLLVEVVFLVESVYKCCVVFVWVLNPFISLIYNDTQLSCAFEKKGSLPYLLLSSSTYFLCNKGTYGNVVIVSLNFWAHGI
jgi:hypothetical protein